MADILTMENRKEFGQRIVVLRTEQNISQDQLATMAGITQNNLSRIENGKYSAGLDVLLKIGKALEKKLIYG